MLWLSFKYLVTATIVVAVSEFARRSDRVGAFVAALPLVTILAMIWLHSEGQPTQKVANHAYYTFWYVLPTLPMFLVFPWLLSRLSFWLSLFIGISVTCVCFALFVPLLRRFGIELLP